MAQLSHTADGKRDIRAGEAQFDRNFAKLRNEERWQFEQNRTIVIQYIEGCLIGEVRSNKRFQKTGKLWLDLMVRMLRRLSEEWIRKPFDEVADDEWRLFYRKMESGVFLTVTGTPFKQTTKSKTYKVIRKFLKWRYGNDLTYPSFCEHWDTRDAITTRPFLTRPEIDRLVTSVSSLKLRCLFMMLFDGGFRIQELGNLRWCDLRKHPERGYYQAHVRSETSKTNRERYVSLHLSTDYIDSLRQSRISSLGPQFKDQDYLFPVNYGTFYKTIKRAGRRILGKNLSPHIFRHSSATYYANVIKTYQQFCARYGWDLNSKTAQRYLHSVFDDEVADQTRDHEIGRFKADFERTKLENRELTDELTRLRDHQAGLQAQLNQIQNAIASQATAEIKSKLPTAPL